MSKRAWTREHSGLNECRAHDWDFPEHQNVKPGFTVNTPHTLVTNLRENFVVRSAKKMKSAELGKTIATNDSPKDYVGASECVKI